MGLSRLAREVADRPTLLRDFVAILALVPGTLASAARFRCPGRP
jgi:hypothetical protein